MSMLKKLFKLTGIRRKLFLYSFSIVMLMGLTGLYSYYNAKYIIERTNTLFGDYVDLNQLYLGINSTESDLENYLATQSSEALLNYYTDYNNLQRQMEKQPKDLSYDPNTLMLKDIYKMTGGFLQETDAAVNAKRGRKVGEGLEHLTNAKRISGYIKQYINDLLYNTLNISSKQYALLKEKMTINTYISIFVIGISFIFNLFLALVFTYRITKPLVELATAAKRIAREDFEVELIKSNSQDEIGILTKAFNQMVISLRQYIENMRMKAETEKRLGEQEMQNLKIRSLLKDAELKALQAQINPHFFFNTLNYAAQLAMLEGADESSVFIQKAAELFRYSLKGIDRPVTLQDEIKNIKTYSHILKARFKERINFYFNIQENDLDIEVPGLILQPLVENSFIHGLEDVMHGGVIYLNVQTDLAKVFVEIIDNGKGIPEEKLEQISKMGREEEFGHDYHTTGLGLRNVIERLMLFYGVEEQNQVIEIHSKLGVGTRILIKLPKKGGEQLV